MRPVLVLAAPAAARDGVELLLVQIEAASSASFMSSSEVLHAIALALRSGVMSSMFMVALSLMVSSYQYTDTSAARNLQSTRMDRRQSAPSW